jgi:hypothetical protein
MSHMKRQNLLIAAAWGVLLIGSYTDLLPSDVRWFAFGLLLAHWASRELAKFRAVLTPYEPDWDTRPSKPIFAEPPFEDETVERYEYRIAQYDVVRDAWVLDQAKRMVTSSR